MVVGGKDKKKINVALPSEGASRGEGVEKVGNKGNGKG